MKAQFSNPKFYNQALPTELDIPAVPVGAVLQGAAKHFPEHIGYTYKGHSIAYKDIYTQALRFANSLQALGIQKGDVVAIYMQNCTQYPVAYYGILLAGATYTPVNPMLPKDEMIFQIKDSEAVAIISYGGLLYQCLDLPTLSKVRHIIGTDDAEIASLDETLDTKPFQDQVISLNKLIRDGEEKELQVAIDAENDVAHLAYTGGTTGRSKGVITTHKNVVSCCLQSIAWSNGMLPQVDEDGALTVVAVEQDRERYLAEYPTMIGEAVRLSPAPFAHGAGALGGLVYAVAVAAKTVIFERFLPEEFIGLIESEKVTEVSGAPAMFNFLLFHPDMRKRDLSSVRIINSGTAPIADETMKMLEELFPNAHISEGYGLTEATATCVLSTGFKSGTRKVGSVGLPIYNTEVKLMSLSAQEPAEITVPGERGEIVVRGPQVMKGYLNNPQATNETLIDGWLYTGDIGVFDEDGFLSIVDRKKDMLIYNGYNVYPRQIEEILYTHPAVQAAVVIGINDAKVGEKPKAFVVLKPGATATEEEVMDFVNTKVVHYSKIREIEFIDQLPMTTAGKISKIKLVELEQSRR